MRVTPESPVQDRDSYLYKWDTTARRYFDLFEVHKNSTREHLRRIYQSFLTRNRDPVQYSYRYEEVDNYTIRQLLGDISHQEVHELNSVFGTRYGLFFTKGVKEPASIVAWRVMPFAALWGFGAGVAAYGKFVKGYNILWLAAGFAPFWTYAVYNYFRQPTQNVENCYRYLLAKRAATCELDQNQKLFNQNGFVSSPEF